MPTAASMRPVRFRLRSCSGGVLDHTCETCIRGRLGQIDGLHRVNVTALGDALDVEAFYDPTTLSEDDIRAVAAGAEFVEPQRHWSPATVARWLWNNNELGLALLGGLLLIAGFLVYQFGGPDWLRFALLGLSAMVTSTRTFPHAIEALRNITLDVDVLMFVAAIGAAVIGHPEEGAFLLFLFGLGHAGEHLAMRRARKAIDALTQVAPATAWRIADDGSETQVPVEQLTIDDRVRVRPFDRMPADGCVVDGESAVDQASITGESIPVEKSAGDDVFAGTINGSGQLVVRVTRPASESTLARIIRMVEEAQASQSPTQRFTERVERKYVPIVFAATLVLIFLPPLAFAEAWGTWFYRAMAFLTAASPCALAIGTPTAVLCGVARSARIGVLIKGGAYLELLGRVDAIAFDKTGTLTTGRPIVTDLLPADGISREELLGVAAAVEAMVSHPLAEAIAHHAGAEGIDIQPVDHIDQQAGHGVSGMLGGRRVAVGKVAEADRSLVAHLSRDGKTTVAVHRDQQRIGFIALADEPRSDSRPVMQRLRGLGVDKLIMITGDHAEAGHAVGQFIGMDEVFADLLPEQKVEAVRTLKQRHGTVAMIGDGVNDAPALAVADVGIAMGAAGADVAMETADVVLMGSDLRRLPEAVALSRKARRIIAENLIIALGVIVTVAPLAAAGFANLPLAVLLHEGSTVVVVLNSLRLLRRTPETAVTTDAEHGTPACERTCSLQPLPG